MKRGAAIIGVTLGAASVLAGQVFFSLHRPYPPPPRFSADPSLALSLSLFLGGALLTLIGLLGLPLPVLHTGEASDSGRRSRWHWCAVAAILLLAFAVRAYRITEMPPPLFDDEANTALDAMKYLNGEFPSLIGTGWGEVPVVYTAMNSVALRFFGPTVLGARVTGLVFGTGTVLALYFVARAMTGSWIALMVMLGFALQRWHIIMSRWGASEIALPLFACLAFLFTARGFDLVIGADTIDPWSPRRPRRGHGATGNPAQTAAATPGRVRNWGDSPLWSVVAGGALLGFCMYIYLASRLVAVGMSLFLAYLLIYAFAAGARRKQRGDASLAQLTTNAVLYGLVYLAVFAPMALYYYQHPGVFTSRYKNISLPQQMGIGSGHINWEPLLGNLSSYALMLNYTGNEISRHCLPFQPLLNVVSGTLFALGMVFLLRHWWRPANAFCLLWVCLPLLGGAITVSETPSPYRTIVAAPAVALVMLIPLYYLVLWLGQRDRWYAGARARLALSIGVGGLLLASGGWNVYTYWTDLRHFPGLFRHYNYAEYAIAEHIREIPANQPVYLYPHYYTFSSVKLLNWHRPNMHLFSPSQDIPIMQPEEVPIHIILPLFSQDVLPALRLFHPHAQIAERRVEQVPGEGHYEVVIPVEDLDESRGLWVSANGGNQQRTRSLTPPATSDLHEATWEARLDAPEAGAYQFSVRSSRPLEDRCTLTIAGQAITSADQAINLLAGGTQLRLSVQALQPDERLDLLWRRPNAGWASIPLNRLYAFPRADSHGLRGTYYLGTEPAGTPYTQRIDLFLSANESMPSPHSVRWTGFLNIPRDGTYDLAVRADDGTRLWLDGKLMIDKWEAGGTVTGAVSVVLHRGAHPLQVDYFDQGGGRIFEFTWKTPDGRGGIVPFDVLSHAQPETSRAPFHEPQTAGQVP